MRSTPTLNHKHWKLVNVFVRGVITIVLSVTAHLANADQILKSEILSDPSNQITISEIQKLKLESFDKQVNIGLKANTIWLRLEIAQNSTEARYLVFNMPTIDKVSIFTKASIQSTEWTEIQLTPREIFSSFKLDNQLSEAEKGVTYIKIGPNSIGILGIRVLNESEWQEYKQKKIIFSAIQIGAACTLLVWSLLNWFETKNSLYSLLSFNFLIINLRLLMQSGYITYAWDISNKESSFLMLFFLLLYGMNTIYLIHRVLNDPLKQKDRKHLYWGAYAAIFCLIVLNSFSTITLMTLIGFVIFGLLIGLMAWDFTTTVSRTTASKKIIKTRWIIISTLIAFYFFELAKLFFASQQLALSITYGQLFNISWLITGLIIMKLLSMLNQETITQSITEALNATKLANLETKRRVNQQRFLSMLMHEIRTPLSVIKIGADSMAKLINSSTESKLWSKRTNVAIENITQVIENCIQAEKHEEGLIQPKISKFQSHKELLEIISQILLTNSDLAARLKVSLLTENNVELESDINYTRSILFNLISNAFKYSPVNTPIQVRIVKVIKDQKPAVMIEVENELESKDQIDLTQLFQRYYRSESAKKYSGTGLGLWLSQSLANQLNTNISVELKNRPSVVFNFTIPFSNS